MPSLRRWIIATVVLGALAWLVGTQLSDLRLFQLGIGMGTGIIMLSLVPLIGWGGQINLAPLTFAGIGAVVMGHFGGSGTIWGLFLAMVVTAAVGALVALPALRLQGLYLALATRVLRRVHGEDVLQPEHHPPQRQPERSPPRSVGPLSFESNKAHLVLLSVAFGLVALFLVWLRRGEFARRLLAMKASPAACVTLGLNLTRTKLQVFALSAGIAGLGGALLGAQSNSVSPGHLPLPAGPARSCCWPSSAASGPSAAPSSAA